jgi:hypothetical protein
VRFTCDNTRRGWAARGAGLSAPILVSMLLLAGISAVPAVDLGNAHRQRRGALQRLDELSLEVRRAQENEDSSVLDRAHAARLRVRQGVPRGGSEFAVHGLVRFAAGLAGFEVEGLEILPLADSGLDAGASPPLDDVIAERGVELSGRADPRVALAVADWLRGLGLPCAVRSLALERGATLSGSYQAKLRLGLFHFAAPQKLAQASAADTTLTPMPQ